MRTYMKSVFIRFVVIVAMVFMASACGNIRNIRVTSCNIASISPNGLRSVDARLRVGVHNPAMTFTVSDVLGFIHDRDGVIANFTGGPVTVLRKTDAVYELPCSLTLDGKISLFEVLSVVKTMDLSAYFVDVTANVTTAGGITKVYRYKDIPLGDLVRDGNLGIAL